MNVDAIDRKLEIARAERDKKVGKMFFDERQRLLYPLANQITQPMTNEILSLKDPSDDTPENVRNVFLGNLTKLLAGDAVSAQNIMDKLINANFNEVSLSFINASWNDEVKAQLIQKFRSGKTNENAIVMYFKKYIQTFDSNNDGVRDAPVKGIQKKLTRKEALIERLKELAPDMTNTEISKLRAVDIEEMIKRIESEVPSSSKKVIQVSPPAEGKGFKKRMNYTGRGLMLSDTINPKLYVDMNHLNKNRLAVKYKSTKKLTGKPQVITDAQRDSILSILHNEYTEKQYNKLRSEDKELIHDFAIKTQARDVDFITQKDKLRMKFDVLIGEIEAGNDNPDIRRMLRETTSALMKTRGLTRMEGLSLLSQL